MEDNQSSRSARILELYENNKKFTEELLQENERLRLVNQNLKNKVREIEDERIIELPSLKEQIRLLKEENIVLRQELDEMKHQFNAVERENLDFSNRYLEVERQNSSLLNLYVATQRLHSTIVYSEVIQALKEILINMIGTELFEVSLYDNQGKRLKTIAAMGEVSSLKDNERLDSIVKETIQTGSVVIPDKDEGNGKDYPLAACIPLKIEDKVLGVVVVYSLLFQKPNLEDTDYELFELIGEQAMSVILMAHWVSKYEILKNGKDYSGVAKEIPNETEDQLSNQGFM